MPTEDLRERIKALTEGRGVDVVYDPVGGAYTEPAFRSIAWRGRHLVVGFAAGEIPKLPLNLALLKGAVGGRRVLGRFRAPRAEARSPQASGSLTKWFGEGKLKPHVSQTLAAGKGGRGAEADGRAAGEGKAGSYGPSG